MKLWKWLAYVVCSISVTVLVIIACVNYMFVSVPDVVKIPMGEAIEKLEQQGFNVKTIVTFDSMPEGVVFSTYPNAEKKVLKHSLVTIAVSAEKDAMPKLKGMTRDKAMQAINNTGYQINVENKIINAADSNINKVAYTQPAEGVKLHNGDAVKVYYAMPYGNTGGNIKNGGLLVQQNQTLFYQNGKEGGALYKQDLATGYETKLCSDWVGGINVIGSNIYYENYSDCHHIYKIDVNGNNKEKITEDYCTNLIANRSHIYYRNNSDAGCLYRMNLSDYSCERLTQMPVSNININENSVIYIEHDTDSQTKSVCKMSLNGENKQVIHNNDDWMFINVVNNMIYYQSRDKGRTICKTDLDTFKTTQLNNDISAYITVMGDWIYYQNISNNFGLYRMRCDGTQKQRIGQDSCTIINAFGDYVVYRTKQQPYVQYLLETNVLDKQVISVLPTFNETNNVETGQHSSEEK